jgi:hypothetical protein
MPGVMVVPSRGRFAIGQGAPEGRVVDIQHTDGLMAGDAIHITFPFLSTGRLKYGPSVTFTFFGFDKRPGVNKIGVRDPNGVEYWLNGGSRSELLENLKNLSSYDKVVVIRPPGAVQAPNLPPPSLTAEREEIIKDVSRHLSPEWQPVFIRSAGELQVGDILVAKPREGRLVAWDITEILDPTKIVRVVRVDTAGVFQKGKVMYLEAWNPINSWEVVFRKHSGSSFPWKLVGGGLAVAVAGAGLYILFRG